MSTRDIGRLGEELAADYLRAHGCTILARNVYLAHEEIDIIARDDRCICFVEVKTRSAAQAARYGRPAAAVTLTKQRHLIAAAEAYLRRNPGLGQPRMDVVEVYLAADGTAERIVHMPGAFRKR
ncbi:MAG: YraN family protein [Clostridia bacterium]|nr:YraN family protein [Clostridia bacterium]